MPVERGRAMRDDLPDERRAGHVGAPHTGSAGAVRACRPSAPPDCAGGAAA